LSKTLWKHDVFGKKKRIYIYIEYKSTDFDNTKAVPLKIETQLLFLAGDQNTNFIANYSLTGSNSNKNKTILKQLSLKLVTKTNIERRRSLNAIKPFLRKFVLQLQLVVSSRAYI